jgi:hypothetical protein
MMDVVEEAPNAPPSLSLDLAKRPVQPYPFEVLSSRALVS